MSPFGEESKGGNFRPIQRPTMFILQQHANASLTTLLAVWADAK